MLQLHWSHFRLYVVICTMYITWSKTVWIWKNSFVGKDKCLCLTLSAFYICKPLLHVQPLRHKVINLQAWRQMAAHPEPVLLQGFSSPPSPSAAAARGLLGSRWAKTFWVSVKRLESTPVPTGRSINKTEFSWTGWCTLCTELCIS